MCGTQDLRQPPHNDIEAMYSVVKDMQYRLVYHCRITLYDDNTDAGVHYPLVIGVTLMLAAYCIHSLISSDLQLIDLYIC